MTEHPDFQANRDWRTDDFDFDLPIERIAQSALEPRDHARLLHIHDGDLSDKHIYDLPLLLKPNDVLVVNNTKVIPARLYGFRGDVKIELLLHQKKSESIWIAFAKPAKRLKVGDGVVIGPDFKARVLAKHETGEVELQFNIGDDVFMEYLHQYGEPPLPPYIKREGGHAKADEERYQTVYAEHNGAVAAPTAGLHFTPELIKTLRDRGNEVLTVTLHVGAGTFLPVKVNRVRDHVMHAEWGEITAETAERINHYKVQGRRIVAVGTTSLRLLESATDRKGFIKPFSDTTNIFITPGYHFKIVDVLMTNFHLPKSTLFMLVCAFAGYETMRTAYAYAVKENYRFYSYGDATLLERA
jgi:S-adenosylmethionine:tRNA ribosyltransferase-isomerase